MREQPKEKKITITEKLDALLWFNRELVEVVQYLCKKHDTTYADVVNEFTQRAKEDYEKLQQKAQQQA